MQGATEAALTNLDVLSYLDEIPVLADPDGNPRFRMKANTVVFLEK